MTESTLVLDDTPLRRVPRQTRAAEMLARIEKAAVEVIAHYGRDSFTTSQVAQQAGCSVGALYRHFTDRRAILDWLYPDRVEGLGALRPGTGLPRRVVGEATAADSPSQHSLD